jgi:Trk K+ transport system NAD-binding subunit
VDAQLRSDEMAVKADEYRDISRKSAMVLESAVVDAGTPLDGVYVRDARIPSECTLGAIRRANETVVPRGSTLIQSGDEVILLTTQDNQEYVAQWLRERT